MSRNLSLETRRFVEGRGRLDAVIQRIGRDTWDLLLVDQEGNWTREVLGSEDECRGAAEEVGAAVHVGWGEGDIAKRMSRRDHWNQPGGQKRAL